MFRSERDGNPEIYIMRANGQNQINLTNDPASDRAPSWSPNGREIVFSRFADGKLQLFKMESNGYGQASLSGGNSPDDFADWGGGARR